MEEECVAGSRPCGSRGSRRFGRTVGLTLLLLTTLLAFSACGRGAAGGGNLLADRSPSHVDAVRSAERLTDGAVAPEGDPWQTRRTAVFLRRSAFVQWDLGRLVSVRAAYLQGDNNDDFIVWGSEDGEHFTELWSTGAVRGPGMRARFTRALDARLRHVRLTARGGDAAVSAAELQLYEQVPAPWPPRLPVARQSPLPDAPSRGPLLAFAAVACAFLLAHRSSWPRPLWAVCLCALAGAAAWAARAVVVSWPAVEAEINLLRAVAAAVGLAAVARVALLPRRSAPRLVDALLAAMALLAVATFYNLGQPQFHHEKAGRRTFVHTWDMRVYFPTAKYFDELGFDGLYLASVKAFLEDAPARARRKIGDAPLRDLRTYRMTRVSDVIDDVHAVKRRFSPERWEAFKRDMTFFRESMGARGYLDSLRDHGGNATPAWLLVAHLMFRWAPATETTLLAAAALDPLLLLLFFVIAARTFGLRTALVCLIVYGTTTFPWFGSNWAGSTLRNDWMVLLGLGACALKTRRWALGGTLLAAAALIRAFPAVALLFLPVPALLWLLETAFRERRLPSLARILEAQRPLLRVLAGAAGCIVVFVALSSAVFGAKESWGAWGEKITLHSVRPNLNHVGLRAVVAYDADKTASALARTGGNWQLEQVRTLSRRLPIFYGAVAVFTLLAVVAVHRRELHQAALVGLLLVPIWFYPSNYYLHYVFVLPLLVELGRSPRQRALWGLVTSSLLAMSVAQYFGFETTGLDERYVEWSWPALAGYFLILAGLVLDGRRRTRASAEAAPERAPAPAAA